MKGTGIVARTSNINNAIAQKRAKRYIFYPMADLKLHDTQSVSPVWNPNLKRGRITLLETLEYTTQVTGDVSIFGGGGGVQLGLEEQGTDAQVNFLMGTYSERGMTSLASLLDVDPEIVQEIEDLIYEGLDDVPPTLKDLRLHLASRSFDPESDNSLERTAYQTVQEMLDGVGRAIVFADRYCDAIEKEIQEFRSGKPVIKGNINGVDRYYYKQIGRPVPRDKDFSFASEQPVVSQPIVVQQAPSMIEVESYKETLAKQQELMAEQAKMIEELRAKVFTEEETTKKGKK